MLPDFLNQEKTTAISCRSPFAESLLKGYHFEIKQGISPTDVRSLYYYKSDNTLLLSHAMNNRVHLLTLGDGKLKWFDHHGTSVRSIKVKNDRILTGSWDGSIGLTCMESLKLLHRLTEKKMGRCPDAVFSQENEFAYSFTYDTDKDPEYVSNTVRKWKLADGTLDKVLFLPGVHLSGRRCGSCEEYEKKLYVTSDTGHICKYDSLTGILLAEEICSELIAAICILPSFGLLAVGSNNGSIFICDLNSLKIKFRINAHTDAINQLLLHPGNPELMVSASFDGTVKIWHLPDLELIGSVKADHRGLWTVTIINNMLLTGGECSDIKIFNIEKPNDPKPEGTLVITGRSCAYISEDKKSFYASDPSTISVLRDDDDIIVTDQFSEYLVNVSSDLNLLRDLFMPENIKVIATGKESVNRKALTEKNV
jgi:WD40 repeat protein